MKGHVKTSRLAIIEVGYTICASILAVGLIWGTQAGHIPFVGLGFSTLVLLAPLIIIQVFQENFNMFAFLLLLAMALSIVYFVLPL